MTKTQRFISIAMYAFGAALGYYALAIFTGWGINWDLTAWEPKARAMMFAFSACAGLARWGWLSIFHRRNEVTK